MYQLANCLVSVLRGTTTNDYLDEVDTAAVHASGIPAFLTETAARTFDPATQTPRVVRTVTATVPSTTDVTETDRLRDDTRGVTYAVEVVHRPDVPGLTADLRLELRRVT
jgi:hypothetical protein